jgi:hypothetical protein
MDTYTVKLQNFFEDYPNNYYMFLTPRPTSSMHNTVFKIVDKTKAVDEVIKFAESLGDIQSINVFGNRVDFVIDNIYYALFGYDVGVIEVI